MSEQLQAPPLSIDTQRELVRLFTAALDRIIRAIRVELSLGRKPRRKSNEPSVSFRDNGMPSLTNGSSWDATGPLQYADLLEPLPSPSAPPFKRKLEEGRFVEVDDLVEFVRANPGCAKSISPTPLGVPDPGFNLERIMLEIQLAHAANRFFQHHGDTDFNDHKSRALLAPIIRGLFSERVDITTVVPIALVRFNFDRLRLTPDTYIIRMNDTLHRKRWSGKAYGASGHEGVVAAATHAFVITGWNWPNVPWMQMSQDLAVPDIFLRERIEELFAALRLATGVSTGYAQELRLARGWSHLHTDDTPEIYAVGARRYPETFDDFGWMREDLPVIERAQMHEAATVLGRIRRANDDRLTLALRRMNTAMIRSDAADAILDATIGLEILLSDGDSQSIGYKLRLRAGALSNLAQPGSGVVVGTTIKGVYEARSRIVHGARKSKRISARAADESARDAALDMLRRLLMIVLEHPRFLDPTKIDSELLLS